MQQQPIQQQVNQMNQMNRSIQQQSQFHQGRPLQRPQSITRSFQQPPQQTQRQSRPLIQQSQQQKRNKSHNHSLQKKLFQK